jgi:hypothetical protein
MRYVLFNGEKSVQDLAARVFQLSGRKQTKAAAQAVDALLKANPQLSDLKNVPLGTPISVPDSAPPFALQTADVSKLNRTSAVEAVQAAIDTLDARLAEIQTRATESSKSVVELLRSQPFQQAAKTPPDVPVIAKLFPDLRAASKALDAQIGASGALEKERRKSFDEHRKALDDFGSSGT